MEPPEKVRLSEIVAALADALDFELDDPRAARARELVARAGWAPTWSSWGGLLARIGEEDYPEPGLRNVEDDYVEP